MATICPQTNYGGPLQKSLLSSSTIAAIILLMGVVLLIAIICLVFMLPAVFPEGYPDYKTIMQLSI